MIRNPFMERQREGAHHARRGIFLLPNILTTGGLFCGFYAIVAAINGNYPVSAIAIIVAAVFDGLDGRIARLTKTTSRFGVEYDSLSDLVAFGVAPGILAFLWGLKGFGRLGWLAAFLYVATTALRLARFNTLSLSGAGFSKSYFLGLPCPAAAGAVATTVLFCQHMGIEGNVHHAGILAMVYVLSFLMVSNIRYYSFKEAAWFQRHPFSAVTAFVLILTVIATEPKVTLFVMALAYVLSCPVITLARRLHPVDGSVKKGERTDDTPL